MKNILRLTALTLCLSLCFVGCASYDDSETEEEPILGLIMGEVGSELDYRGMYELSKQEEGEPLFNCIEVAENGGMYLYNEGELLGGYGIDYSEQRALNGNPLMVISIELDGKSGDIGISAHGSGDGGRFLDMSGDGEFKGFEATYKLTEGSMLMQTEDEASDYLLDELQKLGYDVEGTAVLPEDVENDPSAPAFSLTSWFFVWGKNDAEKFTAEKRFVVIAPGEIWEYDVVEDIWNGIK